MPFTEQQRLVRQKILADPGAYLIAGDVDKPFHRPECACRACEEWRADDGRPTHWGLFTVTGWYKAGYHCSVCGSDVYRRTDTDEGRLYESEEECRTCKLCSSEMSYGHNREVLGYVSFEWDYNSVSSHSDERRVAAAELRKVYEHPEFAAMREAPEWALADWLGDHDFPIQEAGLREKIRGAQSGETGRNPGASSSDRTGDQQAGAGPHSG